MAANTDAALLALFRAEVETHMAVLNDGLLTLEKQPERTGCFEELMRAAHSIKGAAKIIDLAAAVHVAHAIEDCFVAARQGQTCMTSDLVDVLLQGVDLLGRTTELDDDGSPLVDVAAAEVEDLVARIARAMRGATEPTPAPRDPQETAEIAKVESIRAPAHVTGLWVAAQRERLQSSMEKSTSAIQIDCTDVTSWDASSVGFLSIGLHHPSHTGSAAVQLLNVGPDVQRFLVALGLGACCLSKTAEV